MFCMIESDQVDEGLDQSNLGIKEFHWNFVWLEVPIKDLLLAIQQPLFQHLGSRSLNSAHEWLCPVYLYIFP